MERHAAKGAEGTRGRESRAKHTVFFFSSESEQREKEREAKLASLSLSHLYETHLTMLAAAERT